MVLGALADGEADVGKDLREGKGWSAYVRLERRLKVGLEVLDRLLEWRRRRDRDEVAEVPAWPAGGPIVVVGVFGFVVGRGVGLWAYFDCMVDGRGLLD